MTPKLLSRLPGIKWISIIALIVLVVAGGWLISPYNSFWFFLKENLGQVSGYALLVVTILYVSFSLIEYFVEKNVRLNRWLEEVYRITRDVQVEEDEESLMKHGMTDILDTFEFDRAVFFMAGDAALPDDKLRVAAVQGFPIETFSRISLDLKRDSIICQSIREGTPKVYETIGEAAFDRNVLLGEDGSEPPERFAVVPMHQAGRITGVLYVDRVRKHRRQIPIGSEEVRLLGTYMDQVSVVLQRLRLLNREKELSKTLTLRVEEALERERKLEEKLRLSETLAALGEMAASLTHEIKNPLGGLDMYARLLQRDMASDAIPEQEKKDLVSKIIDGVKTLDTVVGNLLGYARVARGEMNERIFLADVIDSAADFATPEIERMQIRHDIDAPNHIQVMGNFDQLRQVFLNLLLNAVQAMHETGGILTVRVICKESKSGSEIRRWAVTEITDTGVGMTEEQKSRIFEDFYTTREKGTGLGLAISRKIVKVHGGEITFESEWKKGSTFRIYLPLAQPLPAAAAGAQGKG